MGKTTIEWTEATWNPVRGCSRLSEGCRNCYAERMAARFARSDMGPAEWTARKEGGDLPPFHGFAHTTPFGPRWTGRVELIPDMLDIPLRRRKPTTYFVNSMSDLFHEALPDEVIDRVFAVMALCPQHRFQVLTKRATRMREYLGTGARHTPIMDAMNAGWNVRAAALRWPLPNVWLGVSVEDQVTADERIPHLLQTPAAVRFVSAEPLLGEINFRWARWEPFVPGRWVNHLDGLRRLDWVIVGGESGPEARPMKAAWAQSIRDQCVDAKVPFFFKQWGEWLPGMQDGAQVLGGQHVNASDEPIRVGKKAAGRLLDGRTWDEMPEAPHA